MIQMKKIKGKIRFYKALLIEIIETLCSICLFLKTLEKLKQEPCENDVIANSLITVANKTLDSAIEIISIINPYMRIPENWKEEQDERR